MTEWRAAAPKIIQFSYKVEKKRSMQRLHNHVEVVAARHGEIALLMAARAMVARPADLSDDDTLCVARLLALNLNRAAG